MKRRACSSPQAPTGTSGAAACRNIRPAFAGVMLPDEEYADLVLAEAAWLLETRGLVLARLIQESEPNGKGYCCPGMFVRDLSGAG